MGIEPEHSGSFPLYFRIPAWCNAPRITLNGSPQRSVADDKGFVRIARTWAKGDVVELTFPMTARVARGVETEFPDYPKAIRDWMGPKVPAAWFQKRRFPYASVYYGPLLFALAIPDKDPNTPVPGAHWQYALDVAAPRGGGDIRSSAGAMPAHWDWPLAGPLVLKRRRARWIGSRRRCRHCPALRWKAAARRRFV